MKKIILTLLAAIAALSVDAQIIEVYRDGAKTAVFDENCDVKFRAKKINASGTHGSYPRNRTNADAVGTDPVDQGWVQLWAGGPRFAVNVIEKGTGDVRNLIQYGEFVENSKTVDAAEKNWGQNWRTPTLSELTTMIAKCSMAMDNGGNYLEIRSSISGEETCVRVFGTKISGVYTSNLWTSNIESDGNNTKRFSVKFTYTNPDYGFTISALGEYSTSYLLAVLNE